MAEKKLTVRFSTQGGQQVRTDMQGIGQAGEQAFGQIERSQKSAADSAAVFEAALEREGRAFRDLRASLDPAFAATQRYEAAVEQATQAVRMGIATQEEANRVIAMARGRMDGLTTGAAVVGRGMSSMRFQVQNAAFQIGDFATQVGAGTSASIALGQQLPQLLGGFGMLGAVLGAGVAIGVPLLAAAFRDTSAAADTLTDSVGALEQAMAQLREVNDVYTAEGLQEQIDKYGELNAEILLLIERQRQFAVDRTILAASEAAAAFKREMSDLLSELAIFQNAQATLASEVEGSLNFALAFGTAQDSMARLQEEFGFTVDEAQALEDALNAALSTNEPKAMADALAVISGLLEDSTLKGGEFAGALLDAESALRQINALGSGIGGWIGAAISQAGSLAGQFWEAARAAASMRAAAAAPEALPSAMPMGGPGTFPVGTPTSSSVMTPRPVALPPMGAPGRPQSRPADIDFGYTPSSAGSGSPGGGGATVAQAPEWWDDLIDKVREGEQAFESYNRTVERGAETMADFFGSIVDGSKSAKEAIADLLMQLAQVQIQRAFLGLAGGGGTVGNIFGALGSALTVPSFDGGGYTGSSPRAGGLDGRGGFLAMMHPQETVTDHTKGQSAQAMTINVNVSGTSGDQAIEQAVARGVSAGISAYDRQLAARVRQVNRDPRGGR
jgi:hypothetical protein